LSSVRNLFAGVLLLFKYKIATTVDDPNDAYSLIFNPPEVLPHTDGSGGIEWRPTGNFRRTTIDIENIKKRFRGFGISVDWVVIDQLQDARNQLEHLHPANTMGEVADFVAALVPVLQSFITDEMGEVPAELLGSTWTTMLNHHQFFKATMEACRDEWKAAKAPEGMQNWLNRCQCDECGSTLVRPVAEDIDVGMTFDDEKLRYLCVACNNSGEIVPLMIGELVQAQGDYNEFDGEESPVDECDQCNHYTFVVSDGRCHWCEYELEYPECKVCGEMLRQDDQDNSGFCGYHLHQFEKVMRDD
jgi:hypothetical protein